MSVCKIGTVYCKKALDSEQFAPDDIADILINVIIFYTNLFRHSTQLSTIPYVLPLVQIKLHLPYISLLSLLSIRPVDLQLLWIELKIRPIRLIFCYCLLLLDYWLSHFLLIIEFL